MKMDGVPWPSSNGRRLCESEHWLIESGPSVPSATLPRTTTNGMRQACQWCQSAREKYTPIGDLLFDYSSLYAIRDILFFFTKQVCGNRNSNIKTSQNIGRLLHLAQQCRSGNFLHVILLLYELMLQRITHSNLNDGCCGGLSHVIFYVAINISRCCSKSWLLMLRRSF